MNHQQIIELGLSYSGSSLRYPFDPAMPVLFVGSKMFALMSDMQGVASVNLKTSPDEAWLQRETYPGAVLPGYHMNKRHWNTVLLDGRVPDDAIAQMIMDSYQLVYAKLTKLEKAEIAPGWSQQR